MDTVSSVNVASPTSSTPKTTTSTFDPISTPWSVIVIGSLAVLFQLGCVCMLAWLQKIQDRKRQRTSQQQRSSTTTTTVTSETNENDSISNQWDETYVTNREEQQRTVMPAKSFINKLTTRIKALRRIKGDNSQVEPNERSTISSLPSYDDFLQSPDKYDLHKPPPNYESI